jgi:CSLREA domain-containing protein
MAKNLLRVGGQLGTTALTGLLITLSAQGQTFTVTTTADTISGSTASGSLRDAILAANSGSVSRIVFANTVGGTLTLNSPLPPIDPKTANGDLTIDASAAATPVQFPNNRSLTMAGTGTLFLNDIGTGRKGVTVLAGAVEGDTNSLQGNITNDGSVLFNQANSGTYAGAIAGPGSLTKENAGTLTLTGSNNIRGGTTVAAGILRLGTGGSLGSAGTLTVQSGAVFDLNGNRQTVGGLFGGGNVTLGSGTLSVLDSASSPSVFGGVISGTGGLVRNGGGSLTLTGTNTFTGGTTIEGGTLVVMGSLASGVTVEGGTLSGTGTINGDVDIESGARLLPGNNSVGTLLVKGNYTQGADSRLAVYIGTSGQLSDSLAIDGKAMLLGGTVRVFEPLSGSYAFRSQFSILTTTEGLSGRFDKVSIALPFPSPSLVPTLSYGPDDILLTVTRSDVSFDALGTTPNQKAVGAALDQMSRLQTLDLAYDPLFNAVVALPAGSAGPALDELGAGAQIRGAMTTSGIRLASLLTRQFLHAARDGIFPELDLAEGMAPRRVELAAANAGGAASAEDGSPWLPPIPLSAWISGFGLTGRDGFDGNGVASGYTIGGGSFGLDYQVVPELTLGIGLGYAHTDTSLEGLGAEGSYNTGSVAIYGGYRVGPAYLLATVGYAYNAGDTRRSLAIPGLVPATATATQDAQQFLGGVETGYAFEPSDGVVLTPFAGVESTVNDGKSFQESGAGSLDLSVAGASTAAVRSVIGSEIATAFILDGIDRIDTALRLGWAHELTGESTAVTAQFAQAPGVGFTVVSAKPERDTARIGMGAGMVVSELASLFLRYDGDVGAKDNAHALTTGLKFAW